MTDLPRLPAGPRGWPASPLSRRRFLRAVGVGSAVAASAPILAACGTPGAAPGDNGTGTGTGTAAPTTTAQDLSDQEKVLNFSNWPFYIDVDDDDESLRPTLAAFEEETGISVEYTEDINDNDQFFGRIRPQLQSGQAIGRDIIVLTDWMAARLIRLGYVQQLDKGNIPNAGNLIESLAAPSFDEDRAYSLPWQAGLTGIAYNARVTGKEIRTIEELFTDPSLRGRVTALTEMRDTMGLVMLAQGADPSNFTDDEFDAALGMLSDAVDSGQIRQFTGNEYAQQLGRGSIAAAIAWSGDVLQLQFEDPDIKFIAPESGLMIWADNMLIPNGATHKKNAELLMDYYYRPEVAAELAAWVNYICPVEGAQEAMREIDEELADNPLIFPDDELQSQSHSFMALDQEKEEQYASAFAEVTGT